MALTLKMTLISELVKLMIIAIKVDRFFSFSGDRMTPFYDIL